MTTTTLDKLYLEWSQFTEARTRREITLCTALKDAVRIIEEYDAAFPYAQKDGDDEAVHVMRIRIREAEGGKP